MSDDPRSDRRYAGTLTSLFTVNREVPRVSILRTPFFGDATVKTAQDRRRSSRLTTALSTPTSTNTPITTRVTCQ